MSVEAGLSETRCSRAGCGAAASHRIVWRNPSIHAADRSKTWLACGDHVEYLRVFLAARSFPVAVSRLDTALDAAAKTGVSGTVTA